MTIHNLILCTDIIDFAEHMDKNPVMGDTIPVPVMDPALMTTIDMNSDGIVISRTDGHFQRKDLEQFEAELLRIKAESYKGAIIFVNILGVLLPCMAHTIKIRTTEEVPADFGFHVIASGTITTIHGRRYEVFCGDIALKSFCGRHEALSLQDPLVYTGGFA